MLCLIHEVGRNDILVWYGRWAGQIDLLLALILHVPGHTPSFCTFIFDSNTFVCFFSFAGCKGGKSEIHLKDRFCILFFVIVIVIVIMHISNVYLLVLSKAIV